MLSSITLADVEETPRQGFLTLPKELRFMIYDSFLCDLDFQFRRNSMIECRCYSAVLTKICSTIRSEVLSLQKSELHRIRVGIAPGRNNRLWPSTGGLALLGGLKRIELGLHLHPGIGPFDPLDRKAQTADLKEILKQLRASSKLQRFAFYVCSASKPMHPAWRKISKRCPFPHRPLGREEWSKEFNGAALALEQLKLENSEDDCCNCNNCFRRRQRANRS